MLNLNSNVVLKTTVLVLGLFMEKNNSFDPGLQVKFVLVLVLIKQY